ncbi:MotA/TolQ/ExbB proton channel family protein [Paraburkholderia phenazinium]|jgi:biopolymer transport protein ExbB|uniref:Outer membrane transport energization protein ExbB n=1 Tax=Paraburkholderia phenazinium TaxID=60549 RepID=A0A1G8KBU6_9BURK|nr:MotA/TolQ/ExbB proton channel family protein [Paraburkholderia phenazinium]SDI40882.1 outer membrane transport energization protein ExbB [Paraburkholderia phenazinium]
MNDWTNLADAARVGGWVIYPLTVLAVIALAITLDRAYAFWRFARMPGTTDSAQFPGRLPQQHAFSRIGRLLDDSRAPLWRIETRVEATATQIERDMSRGLWLLETIVTAAPLLGLLGTIVGMMHSFKLIGGDGLVNPSGVTGGVAQALIATAIGLVIALVALFAFNFFSRRIDRLMDELESFANEALSDLRLASEQGGRPS